MLPTHLVFFNVYVARLTSLKAASKPDESHLQKLQPLEGHPPRVTKLPPHGVPRRRKQALAIHRTIVRWNLNGMASKTFVYPTRANSPQPRRQLRVRMIDLPLFPRCSRCISVAPPFRSVMQHEESRRERKLSALSALSAHYFGRQIPRCWRPRASSYPSASRPASPLHGSGGTVAVECRKPQEPNRMNISNSTESLSIRETL